jgi:hypothetical protein
LGTFGSSIKSSMIVAYEGVDRQVIVVVNRMISFCDRGLYSIPIFAPFSLYGN